MSNQYITLEDSTGPLYGTSKKFKVLQMKTPRIRTDGLKYLLDGSIDKSAGTILRTWQYMLRVPFNAAEGYGDIDDLIALFTLNDPNGEPNDTITLIDHMSDVFYVYFTGELSPENLTTILDGENSVYIVTIALQEKVNA